MATLGENTSKGFKTAEARIRFAWIFACMSGFLTLGASLLNAQREAPLKGLERFNISNLLDAALIFFLALTIFHKSRVGAGALLLYWSWNVFTVHLPGGNPVAIGVGLGFLSVYALGFKGTIDWQRLRSEVNEVPPSAD